MNGCDVKLGEQIFPSSLIKATVCGKSHLREVNSMEIQTTTGLTSFWIPIVGTQVSSRSTVIGLFDTKSQIRIGIKLLFIPKNLKSQVI